MRRRFTLALLAGVLATTGPTAQAGSGWRPAPADTMRDTATTLALTEVRLHPDAKGPDLSGRLPGGAWVTLDFRPDGTLEDIEAKSLAPLAEVAAVLPAVVHADPLLHGAQFEKLDLDDAVEIEGRDAQGRRFKAEYTASGALAEIKFD